MTIEETKALIRAIAIANGHPAPDDYVALVVAAIPVEAPKE